MWARLWNDGKDYDVQLNLQVRELRGLYSGYAITRVDLLAGITVEAGTYNLQSSFQGRREKANVRVETVCCGVWKEELGGCELSMSNIQLHIHVRQPRVLFNQFLQQPLEWQDCDWLVVTPVRRFCVVSATMRCPSDPSR